MKGFLYRRAVGIKEFGERLAHVRVLGVRVLYWASGPVIALGLGLRDRASKFPIC